MKENNPEFNKYRVHFLRWRLLPSKTESYTREKIMLEIANWKTEGKKFNIKLFSGKKIDKAHEQVLIQCATLVNEMTQMEQKVKSRIKKACKC